MSGIANRFKQIREDKHLTITAMAELVDENRQRITDIESGKQRIPEDIILKFIEHFNIDANWLMTGEGNMYKNIPNDDKPFTTNRRLQMMLKIMEALPENEQDKILSTAKDAERLNHLEQQIAQITERLSA